MKDRTTKFVFIFLLMVCAGFITCENPIIEKWWDEDEPFYIPITKYIPEVYYEEIIKHEIVYETVYEQLPPKVIVEQLPPEIIIQYVPEYIYEIITKELTIEDIQEIIKQLPPEYIFEYLTDTQIDHIKEILTEEIYEQLPPKVIVEIETVYEYIYETKTVYETIYEEITRDPTEDEIIEFIKQLPPEYIYKYLTETQYEYIKSQIPPEVIVQQLPPEIFIQYITIVDIEFIIFSGDATVYNGNSPSGGTNLTAQEKSSNDAIVTLMTEELAKPGNEGYMLLLHGHANPVNPYDPKEAAELEAISLARANSVEDEIKREYSGSPESLNDRITTRGYGSEHTISVPNATTYAGLNRRVEVILITVGTTPSSNSGGNNDK